MPTYHGGRHEYGQNFLNDRTVIHQITSLVRDTEGPIIEIGSGGGALTGPLSRLGRSLTAVEIDPKQSRRLAERLPDVPIINTDFLTYRLPQDEHVIVGNLPFHITTAVLRKLLYSGGWSDAILVVQWEVARRRAGVGGATMMTAQWWPWFTFTLHGRIPAKVFTPSPGVDAGLISIARRSTPLLPEGAKSNYRAFVHSVFTGKGRGIRDIVGRLLRSSSASAALQKRLHNEGIRPAALPRDLTPRQWVGLYHLAENSGWCPRSGSRHH